MKLEKGPTYEELVREILRTAAGPVAIDNLVNDVLALKPNASKKPRQVVKSKLRELEGQVLVYLDADHVLSVPLAYQGARFRIRLNQEAINREAISVENFKYILPPSFEFENIQLIDQVGSSIPFQIKTRKHERKNLLFGTFTLEEKWVRLKEWFHHQKMQPKDHLLVTVEDRERGVFRLEHEAFGKQQPKKIKERDQFVANLLYQMLESARSEYIYLLSCIPTLYARLPDKSSCPPDHWHFILQQDERMKTDGIDIRYADNHTLWEDLIGNTFQTDIIPKSKPKKKHTKKPAKEVYCFRAAFQHRTSTWRDIEIQGEQTLGDLDLELRTAFNHDTFDHLSGFWKLVARGSGKQIRYREVAIGNINPFEGGEAAHVTVDSLGLQVADKLKYVYDFGDWIEHTLTLNVISDPQPAVEYPREVARNTPKHKYCVNCKEQDKKTVATWICITCSEDLGQEVLLCENCMDSEHHETHYLEEHLY